MNLLTLKLFHFHLQNIRYFMKSYKGWLAAVTSVVVYYLKTFAEFFCQPSLFDTLFV